MPRLTQTIVLLVLTLTTITTQADIQNKIVGGDQAQAGDYPFFSALLLKKIGLELNNVNYTAYFMTGAPATQIGTDEAPAALADCGAGGTFGTSVCTNVDGKICLIKRGVNKFFEKAKNCQDGNGVGVIIFDDQSSIVLDNGTVNNDEDIVINIPVLSISQADGGVFINALGSTVNVGFSDEIPTRSFCGGSYIGDGWILTAAHCVFGSNKEAILINVGGHDLETDQTNVIGVEEIRWHPLYQKVGVDYDFALIKLLETPQSIPAVKLASAAIVNAAVNNSGLVGIAIGRGLQQAVELGERPELEPPTTITREVDLPIVSNTLCNAAYLNAGFSSAPVTERMLCAGNPAVSKGACFGDSGGPLLLRVNLELQVAGITSWGRGCAQPDLYDVYASIPSLINDEFFTDLIDTSGGGGGGTPSEVSVGIITPEVQAFLDELERANNERTPPPVTQTGNDGSGASITLPFNLILLLFAFASASLRKRQSRTTVRIVPASST